MASLALALLALHGPRPGVPPPGPALPAAVRAIVERCGCQVLDPASRLRSDVGIVYSDRGRIAMAITVDELPDVTWNAENPGLLIVSRLSIALLGGLGSPR